MATMEALNACQEMIKVDPKAAEANLKELITACAGQSSDESLKIQEASFISLGEIYKLSKDQHALADLIKFCRPALVHFPKAKTAKIVRTLVDFMSDIPEGKALQIEVCMDAIRWSKEEKRLFLKQSLETKLVACLLESARYTEALALINELSTELKRMDDKMMLMEVQLLESKACLELKNIPKSKASLTAARTSANAIYCPPLLQAALDMQSGILHAEENDFKTAFSYFYETMEGYSSVDDPRAATALKYMLLSKIMMSQAEEVHALAHGKTAIKYHGPEIEAMKAVAKAGQERSVNEFEKCLKKHEKYLSQDAIVKGHLDDLYDLLMEQNILRIIEPFSKVEIKHIASLIHLPVSTIEMKLSRMVLDKKLNGILDQGAGCLVIFDEPVKDAVFELSLKTMQSLSKVVDSLFEEARKL